MIGHHIEGRCSGMRLWQSSTCVFGYTCADQTWSNYLPDLIMVYIMYSLIVVIIPLLLCESLARCKWRCGSSEESRDVQLALHPTCCFKGWLSMLLKLKKDLAKEFWVSLLLHLPNGIGTHVTGDICLSDVLNNWAPTQNIPHFRSLQIIWKLFRF